MSRRIVRSAIVAHKAEELFALVDDIESYPKFLPWCAQAKVLERTPQGVRATLTIGMRGLRQSFTTQNRNRPPESIELRLVEGPFRRLAGAWQFRPLAPDACSVEFSLEYELGGPLARMLGKLLDHIANTMVDAFKRRADAVYGGSKD